MLFTPEQQREVKPIENTLRAKAHRRGMDIALCWDLRIDVQVPEPPEPPYAVSPATHYHDLRVDYGTRSETASFISAYVEDYEQGDSRSIVDQRLEELLEKLST